MKKVVVGASGQIGSELTGRLKSLYGYENILSIDIHPPETPDDTFIQLDATQYDQLRDFFLKNEAEEVYVMAAILSAKAEKNPSLSWEINMKILFNFLELAKEKIIRKIFWPSSIAVFGPHTPKKNVPQFTVMDPDTVYGISKLAGERWIEYYHHKYDVDVRSIRYPGILSWKVRPGGGTTDYAIEMFHYALKGETYVCYIDQNEELPMMYIDDAIDATIRLMQTSSDQIHIRSSYNLSAVSFTPKQLEEQIKKYIPDFQVIYKPDFRQEIARSWPDSIDDSYARKDWDWKPAFDLDKMVETMLKSMQENYYPASEFHV